MGQKITPYFSSSSLYVVPIEVLSKIASTATLDKRFCSSKEIPNFSKVSKIAESTSSSDCNFFFFLELNNKQFDQNLYLNFLN